MNCTYYLYRVASSYDGFKPEQIPRRMKKEVFDYNWPQYFDQIERGDIIFTYFIGHGVKRGVYMISKILRSIEPNTARAKVLTYDKKTPILTDSELSGYKNAIFTRPRGSVFVIPPFLDRYFEEVLKERVISDIEVSEKIDCYKCFKRSEFPCNKCSIFDRDHIVNFSKEVALKLPGYECFTAPFWVIPYQSHWTKTTISQHTISKIFYSFKAGFNEYSRLFARGIKKAILAEPQMTKVYFDFILGVPLSPRKLKEKEVDRVRELCLELSIVLNVEYLPNGLSLSQHISRREYRRRYSNNQFVTDYCKFLKLNAKSLNEKHILVVDDVITDGWTLRAIAEKIKQKFPESLMYGAAGAIMAKKQNVSHLAIKKFQR